MIDSNQNEFAGSMPVSESAPNWNWLKDRLPSGELESSHHWLDDQLMELEASYAGWMTPKSRQLALQSEFRESRT